MCKIVRIKDVAYSANIDAIRDALLAANAEIVCIGEWPRDKHKLVWHGQKLTPSLLMYVLHQHGIVFEQRGREISPPFKWLREFIQLASYFDWFPGHRRRRECDGQEVTDRG